MTGSSDLRSIKVRASELPTLVDHVASSKKLGKFDQQRVHWSFGGQWLVCLGFYNLVEICMSVLCTKPSDIQQSDCSTFSWGSDYQVEVSQDKLYCFNIYYVA
jgi:hypothetical protein